MTLEFQYAGRSDIGRVRSRNEDRWAVDREQGLFILADGMGGERSGHIASKLVVEMLPGLIKEGLLGLRDSPAASVEERLEESLLKLNVSLREQTASFPERTRMGSTVAFFLIRASEAFVGHMGDSRVYRWRNGQLTLLTRDHSVVQALQDMGEITSRQARSHAARGKLTQCVGMAADPLPETRCLPLLSDDLYLLCSDGLTNMLRDEEIGSILVGRESLEAKCQGLIDEANRAGGEDNVTALLVSIAAASVKGTEI